MKLISIHHYKDIFYALPFEKQAELAAGVFAFGEKYTKNGKCKMVYNFADRSGYFGIWDVDSAEELFRLFEEYPLTPYVNVENAAIVEWEVAAKIMKERIAAAQKAAKK